MAKNKRSRRLRPTPSVEQVAEILAYTDRTSAALAAKQFDVSERSIWRWKARVESGKWQDVAALVRGLKATALERCQDRLNEVYEQALDLMKQKMETATYKELLDTAVEMGGLKAFRDTLDAGSSNTQPAASGTSNAGSTTGAPGGAGLSKVLRVVRG